MRLRRSAEAQTNNYATLPYVTTRRGRVIYRWDAYFATVLDDPMEVRKRDVWELAEILDAERVRAEAIRRRNAEARERHLAAIEIDPAGIGDDSLRDEIW